MSCKAMEKWPSRSCRSSASPPVAAHIHVGGVGGVGDADVLGGVLGTDVDADGVVLLSLLLKLT